MKARENYNLFRAVSFKCENGVEVGVKLLFYTICANYNFMVIDHKFPLSCTNTRMQIIKVTICMLQ